jgi:hypothetical protein
LAEPIGNGKLFLRKIEAWFLHIYQAKAKAKAIVIEK